MNETIRNKDAKTDSDHNDSNAGSDLNSLTTNLTVFIGVKIGSSARGKRFAEIRRTWLQDALLEQLRGRVRIRFFTQNRVGNFESLDVPPDDEKAVIGDWDVDGWIDVGPFRGHDSSISDAHDGDDAFEAVSNISLRSILVPTSYKPCRTRSPGRRLTCLTSSMFKHYLLNDMGGSRSPASFFCNFDDDQYVRIPNLIRVLHSYLLSSQHGGKDMYIGRPQGKRHNTGGAGYCLSRALIERAPDNFTSLPRSMPDDTAVGHVVRIGLGVDPVENRLFHSHLEAKLYRSLKIEDVSRQVSFGYNDKSWNDEGNLRSFPRVPILWEMKDDPMRFRSLRCFLRGEVTGQKSAGCGLSSQTSVNRT
eukprot:CAMPEP_0113585342 /NCGR_PEP_ID=MMETSP0015_2-20120614/33639_1 /TAXON_ID=2838 /ORGANISM="Odontella" /LENGTH=361 /DNA_ID=CAMNT_0000490559 /DNA_START=29 /DNA_END=1110 /DNA_ORIENTATION=+ /assembly_acc=CAM_ASM_000160